MREFGAPRTALGGAAAGLSRSAGPGQRRSGQGAAGQGAAGQGAAGQGAAGRSDAGPGVAGIAGDELELIFMCCHPALAPPAQVALTLWCVCGLSTAEIAAAFLFPEATMAKRLTRAKGKIRDAGVRLKMPAPDELADTAGGMRR